MGFDGIRWRSQGRFSMATSIQIVFDCGDPDRLAKFWASALHYKEQDPPAGYPSWPALLNARGVPEAEWHTAGEIHDQERVRPRVDSQRADPQPPPQTPACL